MKKLCMALVVLLAGLLGGTIQGKSVADLITLPVALFANLKGLKYLGLNKLPQKELDAIKKALPTTEIQVAHSTSKCII